MEKTSQGFWRVPWEQGHWELWNEPQLDGAGLTSQIPFMASLWIRSGYDMKIGKSAETYQVGAHFKALIKAILVAPSRNLEKFFSFRVSLPRCAFTWIQYYWLTLRDFFFIFFRLFFTLDFIFDVMQNRSVICGLGWRVLHYELTFTISLSVFSWFSMKSKEYFYHTKTADVFQKIYWSVCYDHIYVEKKIIFGLWNDKTGRVRRLVGAT